MTEELVGCPMCEGAGKVHPLHASQLPRLDAEVMVMLVPPDGMDRDGVEAAAKIIGRHLTGWAVVIGEGLEGPDA